MSSDNINIGMQSIDPFAWLPPNEESVASLRDVARAIADAYHIVIAQCPKSREQSLAITKLQEARMWANAAIVCNQKSPEL